MVVYRRANRQYVAMPEEEVWRFLDEQRKVYVAFVMKDGYPHVSPIWFCVDGKIVYMRAHDYKVKTALARTGKACITTDAGDAYRELKGVIIWGRSRVVEEPDLIARIDAVLNKKYERQQWRADEMPEWWVADRRNEKRAYIELVPERLDSWDNSRV